MDVLNKARGHSILGLGSGYGSLMEPYCQEIRVVACESTHQAQRRIVAIIDVKAACVNKLIDLSRLRRFVNSSMLWCTRNRINKCHLLHEGKVVFC